MANIKKKKKKKKKKHSVALGWVSRARHIGLREAHTPGPSSSSPFFFTYKKTNTDGRSKKINDGIGNKKIKCKKISNRLFD
jgi:hypothetical protein